MDNQSQWSPAPCANDDHLRCPNTHTLAALQAALQAIPVSTWALRLGAGLGATNTITITGASAADTITITESVPGVLAALVHDLTAPDQSTVFGVDETTLRDGRVLITAYDGVGAPVNMQFRGQDRQREPGIAAHRHVNLHQVNSNPAMPARGSTRVQISHSTLTVFSIPW